MYFGSIFDKPRLAFLCCEKPNIVDSIEEYELTVVLLIAKFLTHLMGDNTSKCSFAFPLILVSVDEDLFIILLFLLLVLSGVDKLKQRKVN